MLFDMYTLVWVGIDHDPRRVIIMDGLRSSSIYGACRTNNTRHTSKNAYKLCCTIQLNVLLYTAMTIHLRQSLSSMKTRSNCFSNVIATKTNVENQQNVSHVVVWANHVGSFGQNSFFRSRDLWTHDRRKEPNTMT
jgi:hypothetical protein